MSTKIRKNIHIRILKYAHRHSEFIAHDLMKELNFNQSEKNLFSGHLMYDKLLLHNTGRSRKTQRGMENIWTISTEGRFRLLEHQQLWWASSLGIIAIFLSTLSMLIAIITMIVK